MNRYFIPTPQTQEEAKAQYRKLAQTHHPDKGGNTATMQVINAEYAEILASLTHTAERRRQAAAHAEGKQTNADYIDLDEVAEILRAKIEEILNLNMVDVEIEIIGLWIWLTGNTKPYKDQLGKDGLKLHWRHQKQAWTFEGVPSRNRTPWELDDIRSKYGSQRITRNNGQTEEDQPVRLGY